MREIRTSGLMSGEGKRSDANAVQTTAPSSTLHSADRHFATVVILPYVFAVLTTFATSAAFYHWLPNVPQRWRDVVPGASLATILWLGLAALFSCI